MVRVMSAEVPETFLNMVHAPATSGSLTGTLWFAYRQSVFFCTGSLQFAYWQPKYREPAAYSPLFSKTIESIIR